MNQNQSAQSIRSNNIRKAPHVLGQALSKLSPCGHSNSPANISRDVNSRVPGNGILNQGHHLQKLIDPSSRKAGGLVNSNSPKGMVHTNKLFLKGFHHEHQKLFTVNDRETFAKGPQFSDYKRVPQSTKNTAQHSKFIFGSPQSSQPKQAVPKQPQSKMGSPASSAAFNSKYVSGQAEQQSNIMNFIKRRTSEEKTDKFNVGPAKRHQAQLIYQDYMHQKCRSPQNTAGGKIDYYSMANKTQTTFGSKQQQSQQQLHQNPVSQAQPLNMPIRQFPQKSRNQGGGISKYKTQAQIHSSQSPEAQPHAYKLAAQMQPASLKKQHQISPKQRILNEKKTTNLFTDKRTSQPIALKKPFSQQNKRFVPMNKPLPTKMDIDDDDMEEDEEMDLIKKEELKKGDFQEENVCDEDMEPINSSRISQISHKKNLKDEARKLWLAVEVGDRLAALKILQMQANTNVQSSLNCTNSDGWAPLHVAASEGHTSLVEILIEYGAIIDARTKNFRTPLHIACIRGNFAVIQTLLMAGSDVDAKDIDGNTPSHFCSEYGHQDCLRFLLTRHPTLFAKNGEGKSPIDVAVNHDMLQTFEEYIKSVKHFLYAKSPTPQNTNITNKNKGNETSLNSSESNNSTNQQKQLNVDEVTLKKRATNKQVQILDSFSNNKPEKKKHLQENPKKNSGLSNQDTTITKKPETFTSMSSNNSNTNSQATDDEKVGPQNFLPIKMIGSGSFGEVYLVKDRKTSNFYAMKVLSKQRIMGQNLVRYAKTERDVLSYTKHPFIVNLNFAFQTKSKLFLILDFCPGGDLGKILQKERKFTEERARIYIAEILLALEDLHKRDIIYRDLKPDNVVLDEEGHALLTDFGLSKEGVLDGAKGAKSFCGSVAYLAPEMLRRVGHGKSVDWYLLGVLLYEMVVGCPPYFSPKKEELFHNIQKGVLRIPASLSEECKNLIVSLLNRNPSKRLGAGQDGADEIKRHIFFSPIDWQMIKEKKLTPPKPLVSTKQVATMLDNVECTEEQIKRLYEDLDECDPEVYENRTVQGWSFVQRIAPNPAGNQQQQ